MVTFSTLILLKHLFAPLALVFGVFLLINYCKLASITKISDVFYFFLKTFILIFIAIIFLSLAFLPFILSFESISQSSKECIQISPSHQIYLCLDHLIQIFSRLFPFGKGLVHAYWAPNVWSYYLFIDMLLSFLHKKFNIQLLPRITSLSSTSGHSATSGLVGDFQMSYLPRITPFISLLLVVLFILPVFISFFSSLKYNPQKKISTQLLIKGSIYTSLTSFMLGYHVHEKAILVALLPATLLLHLPNTNSNTNQPQSFFKEKQRLNGIFLQCSAGGIVGLLPLFPHHEDAILKGTIIIYLLIILFLNHP